MRTALSSEHRKLELQVKDLTRNGGVFFHSLLRVLVRGDKRKITYLTGPVNNLPMWILGFFGRRDEY